MFETTQVKLFTLMIYVSVAFSGISEDKCLEYANIFSEYNIPKKIDGSKEISKLEPTARGGLSHYVKLLEDDDSTPTLCLGSLINDKFILTSAGCSQKKIDFVVVGVDNATSTSDDQKKQKIEIKKIILHPSYDFRFKNYDNIALLELSEPAKFNRYVQPACIHQKKKLPFLTKFVSSDWVHHDQIEPFEIYMDTVTLKSCNGLYKNSIAFPEGIKGETMVCAGESSSEYICVVGESGNTLQYQKEDLNISFIVGVKTVDGCEFGVYTRISAYIPWIEEIAWKNSGCIVPLYPENGYYNISGNVKLEPGSSIPTGSYLIFACNVGYTLHPTNSAKPHVVCKNNKWSSVFPICKSQAVEINNSGCKAPPHPANGYYISGNEKLQPGSSISTGSYLIFGCNAGYTLYPTHSSQLFAVLCKDDEWSSVFPTCNRTCPPRISDSVDIFCELEGQAVDCRKPMPEGSYAHMKCKNHYLNRDLTFTNPLTRCKDGSWDGKIIQCVPECGNLIPKSAQVYVVGGESAAIGEFPWHVGIYRKKKLVNTSETIELICGGSIITTRAVLSVAHCFTEQTSGKQHPKENYLIAAGKYYRDYNDPRDSSPQKSEVEKIIIPTYYRGLQLRYTDDIAVIVVKSPFQISTLVQPVCIDWPNTFEDEQLRDGHFGMVAGWGFTQQAALIGATTLQKLQVPFINRRDCEEKVPPDFKEFITNDKFCAGFTNGSSVCIGDSGGGLVFEKTDMKKFFLRGLVSSGPKDQGSCNSNHYGLYTHVSKFITWLAKIEREYNSL